MKLHLPKSLRSLLLATFAVVAFSSSSAWAGNWGNNGAQGTANSVYYVSATETKVDATADKQANITELYLAQAVDGNNANGSKAATIEELLLKAGDTLTVETHPWKTDGSVNFSLLTIEEMTIGDGSGSASFNIDANQGVQINSIDGSISSLTNAGTLTLGLGICGKIGDITSTGVLKLEHCGLGEATIGGRYDFGNLNIKNSRLELTLWTAGPSDKRNVDAAQRPIITSDIVLDNSTMQIKDGSYQFDGGFAIKGTSILQNDWSKGHTIKSLQSDGQAVLKLIRKESQWGNAAPWTLLNEGSFAGRVEMSNEDAETHSNDSKGSTKQYLVLSNGKALSNGSDVYSTVVNLGNGNYDDRNILSLNTAEAYLKGIGGKGVIEICSLGGNAGLTSAKLIINNDGSVTDVFNGTIAAGVTLEISGGGQTFGQILNNGTIVLSGDGKYVVQTASQHEGFVGSQIVNLSDGTADVTGFMSGTISLFKEGSTGAGPTTVIYEGNEVSVTDGTISAIEYQTYYIGDSVTHTDVYTAAQESSEHGDTLREIVINNGGILTASATLAEKNEYYGNTNAQDKDPFFSGNIKINGGGILKLGENSLGWGASGGGAVSPTMTLVGTNETTLAKVTLDGPQTVQTTINMKGHALIESSADSVYVDTMSTVVNVSGGNNEISVQIRDRGGIIYDAVANSSLTVSGKILAHPGAYYSGTAGTTKKGGGEVIFTAADSVFSGKVNVQGGTLTLSGENTTLNGGAQVAAGAKLSFAATDGKTITVKNGITLGGKVSAKSGIVDISGNIDGGTIEIAQDSSESTKIQLSGTNQVNTVDLSNSNKAKGQLIITGGQTAANELWMRKDAEILIHEGASFKGSTVGNSLETGTITVTGTAGNNTKISTTSDDVQYWADRTDFCILNADVEVSRDMADVEVFNLTNKLDNSSLSNAGSATVLVKNEFNNLTGITASNGNIDIRKITGDSIAKLTIEKEKIVGAHTGDSDGMTSLSNMAKLTVTDAIIMKGNSSLYANLEMVKGVTLTLDGYGDSAATVAGSLTLNAGLTLAGSVLAAVDALEAGDSLVIFKSVSELVFVDNLSEDGVMTLSESTLSEVDASIYFSNLTAGDYSIIYDNIGKIVTIQATVPEPTTATLSLLALAALAARRRRK